MLGKLRFVQDTGNLRQMVQAFMISDANVGP